MLTFERLTPRARIGLKGPRGAQWLAEQGILLPPRPNTWIESDGPVAGAAALLVARLGAGEFFLEAGGGAGGAAAVIDAAPGAAALRRIASAVQAGIEGIYPVPREDAAFLLSGDGALDVLAQVCSVNFAAWDPDRRPVIMTMVIGVAVLIVPQSVDGGLQYRIWCDPTFGWYVDESVGRVVIDCGGSHGGVSA